MLRHAALALALALAIATPFAARADDRTQDERLAALAQHLKDPGNGWRAAYKLVDAGPNALDDLLNALGTNPLADERIEACLREIARTKPGAKAEVQRLSEAARPLTRARLARALAAANVLEALYPIVDALDSPQDPLEVRTYGPRGEQPLATTRLAHPVSAACAAFGERAVPVIRKRLATTGSALFRTEAARTLGAIHSPSGVPDLVALATNEDLHSSVRTVALAALAAIGDPQARDAFSKALVSDDASVRRAALRGLAVAPDPSAIPQVARMLEGETDDDLRLDEVKALAAAEDALAEGPLEAALQGTAKAGEAVRGPLALACADGLARTGARGAPAALVSALELGLGFQVDRGLARALSRIPDLGEEPREKLRTMTDDKKTGETTRACTAWVLALRGEDAPQATLFGLAKSNSGAVRAAVASLLGEGKLDGAVPLLVALAKDQESNVRRAAAVALGTSDDSTAGQGLAASTALALDKDPAVRRAYALAFQDALPQGTLDPPQRKEGAKALARALETDLPQATLEERRAESGTLARFAERGALLRVASGALLASEPPADSRRAAIEALVLLGRDDTVEAALLAAIKDRSVGDDAALAVAKLRGETFFEPRWRELLAPPAAFH